MPIDNCWQSPASIRQTRSICHSSSSSSLYSHAPSPQPLYVRSSSFLQAPVAATSQINKKGTVKVTQYALACALRCSLP